MKRVIIIVAFMLAFTVRGQDAAVWWNALAGDGSADWTPLSLAPVAWYKGENNAVDSSGNSYDGTWVAGETYSDGVNGKCFLFNGSTGYFTATNPLIGKTSVTLAAWCRKSGSGASIGFGYGAAGAGDRCEFIWYTSANIYGECGANDGCWVATEAKTDWDNWHHIVMIFDGSGAENYERIAIYFDGILQNEIATSGQVAANINAVEMLSVGLRNTGYSAGLMDDVIVFGRKLTDSEVSKLFNWRE